MTLTHAILALTIGAIFSNIPHQYTVFDSFSSIENKYLRIAQNSIFCGLVSFGILTYALLGSHWIAFGGALVEIVVNFHYYNNQFKERDWRKRLKKNWAAYFFAVVIPMLILLFSYTYSQLIK